MTVHGHNQTIKPNIREIGWLLKEKYHWGQGKINDYLHSSDHPITSDDITNDIDRLTSGEPIDYIIGHVNFLGNVIDLSLKTLIPRPETEYWVEKVIDKYKKHKKLSVLDLCCGSGCIGISILSHIPGSTVDFIDIELSALEQTRKNLEVNRINFSRVRLIKSNLFCELGQEKYDLVLTNPPYVDENGNFDPGLKYEPSIALFAADSGLSVIKEIVGSFSKFLKPGGKLFLEHGEEQVGKIAKCVLDINRKPVFFQDQFGVSRYLSLT